MVAQYDDKGKIFTQVVSKHPVQVTIQTNSQIIRGTIHVRPNARVKDELNGPEKFVAVTDAVIYNNVNEVLYQCDFLVINLDLIIWLIPVDDVGR